MKIMIIMIMIIIIIIMITIILILLLLLITIQIKILLLLLLLLITIIIKILLLLLLLLLLLIIIIKNFNRRNAHGYHGSKRLELAQHAHSREWHAFTHTLLIKTVTTTLCPPGDVFSSYQGPYA